MDFQLIKHKKPEYAAALEQHLAEHKQILELEIQREAMKMQGLSGHQMSGQQM